MDISRMMKRATSNLKYTLITIVLVTVALSAISSFITSAVNLSIISAITDLIAIAAAISLLVYALAFHEIRGAGILPLLAYFALSTVGRIITFIRGIATLNSVTNLINLVFIAIPVLIAIELLIGIRGLNIYFHSGILVLISLYSLISLITTFGVYPSFLAFAFQLFNSICSLAQICVAAYLSANANK